MSKLRLVKRIVKDSETEQIVGLANVGMSYAQIAREIYGKYCCDRYGEVLPSHIKRVGYVLSREGIRVRSYRNAENREGRAVLSVLRRGEDIVSRLKKSSDQIVRALKYA